MGFWRDLIFGRENQERAEPTQNEPTQIEPPVSDVLLQALMNNEVITREKALTLPAVSGAVDLICNCIASMPVKLYKYRDGKVEEQFKDTRVKLLNGDTSDTLDAFQLKKAMVEDYLLGKGGYCYIAKSLNEVVGLYYVELQSENTSVIFVQSGHGGDREDHNKHGKRNYDPGDNLDENIQNFFCFSINLHGKTLLILYQGYPERHKPLFRFPNRLYF